MAPHVLVKAVLIGLGATLVIDLWAAFVKRVFGVRSLDYCLLGRWALNLPRGIIVHRSIVAAPPRRHECPVGWMLHYLIGTTLALGFALLVSPAWFEHPTLLPALAYGAATVFLPMLTMQPAFGLGIAASRTAQPNRARLKSVLTHTVYGAGLYLWALLLKAVPLLTP